MGLLTFLKKKNASIPVMVKQTFGGWFSGGSKNYSEYYSGWVFACVRSIAEEIANIELELYRKNSSGEDEKITEHPSLKLLNDVNPFFTKYDLFERLQSNLELNGNEYWFLEYAGKKEPQGIYPLMPENCEPIADPNKYVAGYKYNLGGDTKSLSTAQVIHFKNFNPSSDIKGKGTLQACMLAAQTDFAAREYNKSFFENSARPDVILEYPDKLDPDQEKAILDAWHETHGGPKRGFKATLASGGLKINALQTSQADMQFLEQRKFSRDEIMAIFRVPPIVLGIAEVTTYASAKAAAYSFALRTIVPKMKKIVSTLNEFYLPLFGDPSLYFEFTSPVPEDRTEILAEYANGMQNAWLSINDIRRKEGLPEIVGGDAVLAPFSLTPYGEPKPKQLNNGSAVTKMGVEITKGFMPILKSIADAAKKSDEEEKKKIFEKMGGAKKKARDARGTEYEKQFRKRLFKLWADQKAEIKKELESKVKGWKRKAKIPDLLDEEAAVKATIDLMTPLFLTIVEDEGAQAAELLKIDNFEITPNLRKFIERNTKKFAGEVTKETTKQVRATIAAGLEQGEGIDELTDRIDGLAAFGASRSEMIARTETIRAQTKSELEVWKETEVVTKIVWFTAEDERVDDDCADLHGKEIELDENFFDMGDTLPSGARVDYTSIDGPPLHPNCRCVLLPVVE